MFGVFLAQKLAGKPLTVVGDGTQTRDFLYVTDVARAFYAAATTHRRAGDLQSGRGQSAVGEPSGGSAGRPARPHTEAARASPIAPGPTSRRSAAELGWEPQVSFEEGVKTMLENIDYWREAPVWDPSSIAEATKNWFAFLDGTQAEPAS